MNPRDRLARLHFVNTLFHALTGHDLYLASQLLSGIEEAQAHDAPSAAAPGASLSETLTDLHESLLGARPDAGFALCDGAAEAAAGPLWMRAALIAALRRNAPFPQATIMVANLAASATGALPRSRRKRSELRDREHGESVAQLREIAAQRANPHSLVTLLFV